MARLTFDLVNVSADVSYNFGNNPGTSKDCYLNKIINAGELDQQSMFEVGRVNITRTGLDERLGLPFVIRNNSRTYDIK